MFSYLCNFEHTIKNKLNQSLSDCQTASQLAPFINDCIFERYPVTLAPREASVIIGLAFGNRENRSGNPNELAEPGPMNEALAHCCATVYRQKKMPLYLQWEIARFFQAGGFPDIPLRDVYSIEPDWDAQHNLVYLSTDGVVKAIIDDHFDGEASAVGKAVVIGHRDHVKRCVKTCRARGIAAYASRGITLPVWYDPHSWQAWTRRRDLYVLQDMAAQMMAQAQSNVEQAAASQ
ncbi:hypothetical protein [Pantoea sp. 1.19]|uniref:hypothetical protein n=1 Tax=Pantoea sp. 1.19 TaxID=1925589 RepID=UPI000AD2C73B|nr:hypothetical protein [Pantoea sp. 1.19]